MNIKKFFLFLVSALVFSSPGWSSPVDSTEAKNLAQTFWSLKFPEQAKPNFENISHSVGVEHFYVFNNVNGSGFALVSGDDCVIPILGYSGANNCVGGELPENIRSWFGFYDGTIGAAMQNGEVATPEIAEQWNDLRAGNLPEPQSTTAVSPLIATTWNQDAPFNNLCPGTGSDKALVGCVATAMAQLMKYYNWPTTGTGSHSYVGDHDDYIYGTLSANFGATTYDWSNMLNSYPYANAGTVAQQNAVATLMYHCGVSVDMIYSPEWSGAYVTDAQVASWNPDQPTAEKALKNYFDYSPSLYGAFKQYYTDAQWIFMLKNDLNQQHPLIYAGNDQNGEGGHCFICDGYDNSNNFHFNWGWGGFCDGYFALTGLTPYSGGAGGGNYDYTYYQQAIFGAVPNGSEIPAGCEYLHYPLPGNPNIYIMQSGGGYISGTNYYGDLAKADYFTYSGSGSIEKMKVNFGSIDGTNGSVVFTVWADNNGTPGNVLGSKTVALSTIYSSSMSSNGDYECVFDSPIAVNGNFFAGLDISNATSYFGITTTTNGDATNTGWELLSNGQWVPYNNTNSWQVSLTHAIYPYICMASTPYPPIDDYNLVLYEDFSYMPNPMQQSQTVTVNASVGNAGTSTFNGNFKLVLLNANNTEAQVIGQTSGSINSMIYNQLQFTGTVSVPAGTYQMALYYQTAGSMTWTLVGNNLGHANPVSVTVAGGSNPPASESDLNMYSDFIYTPNPIQQNTVAYVTTSIINMGSTAFTGNLRLALETNDVDYVQTIQQIPVSTPLAPNSYAQFNFSGNITADPGFYQLILYSKPNGTSNWIALGSNYNAAYQNPKSVMVAHPNDIDDHAMDAVKIHPNPATNHFYLNLPDQTIDKVEIFTSTGRLVHTQKNVMSGEYIGISFLRNGIYFVRYETSERVGTLKLIVK